MKKNKISKNWINSQRRDIYVRKSKIEGYRSRAVYKLMELDQKFKIFRNGISLIDLGAAPGSWTQYVLKKVKNAKILSTHFTFPEQNHNEIEAFENLHVNNFNIIWINDSGNDIQISKRMNITNELLNNIEHVKVSYNDFNYTTRILKLINLLDWVSYYASIMNKTNPYPVNTITKLKKLL